MASSSTEPTTATEIITRVLFLAPLVHVYAIPPLQSNRGHVASAWTASAQNEIFTARIRVVETSDPSASASVPGPASSSQHPPPSSKTPLTVSILLEDQHTSELFAGAPYTTASVVEATLDSSRFFALRVTGEGGRKAVLGIGFEERSEALDFSIALQEARKVLGLEAGAPSTPSTPSTPVTPRSAGLGAGGGSAARNARNAAGRARPEPVAVREELPTQSQAQAHAVKRNWALKEGQMLHVDLDLAGGKNSSSDGHRNNEIQPPSGGGLKSTTAIDSSSGSGSAFSLLLPPPPSAKAVRQELRKADGGGSGRIEGEEKSLQEMGFDDGEFGEFQ